MSSIAITRASLQTLILGHTFFILLVPLLVALFYYSTSNSRRQPIFLLNVFSVALAFTAGLMIDTGNIHTLLSPQHSRSARFQLTLAFLGNFQMMLVDTILLVRLITAYPPRRIGLVRFALLTSLPVALKVARVVNTSVFIYHVNYIIDEPNGNRMAMNTWYKLPYEKIELIAQVVDNSYASIAFLWSIRTSVSKTKSDELANNTIDFRPSSAAERIRTLFKLALSNFIIPTIMSIAQVVLLFRIGHGHGTTTTLNDMAVVNTNVAIIGVVFATVWAGIGRQQEDKALLRPPTMRRDRRDKDILDGWETDLPVHPHLPLPVTAESHRSENLSSANGVSTLMNPDGNFVRVSSDTLAPQRMRRNSVSQDPQPSPGCHV